MKNMTQKMVADIDAFRDKLTVCQDFAEKYGPVLAEDFPGYLSVSSPPSFHCRVRPYYGDSVETHRANADRVLSAAGKAFGTDGWMRHLNYDRTAYNWKKRLDGVDLVIENAESLEMLTPTPVFPSLFPILLTEHAEVEEPESKAPVPAAGERI